MPGIPQTPFKIHQASDKKNNRFPFLLRYRKSIVLAIEPQITISTGQTHCIAIMILS